MIGDNLKKLRSKQTKFTQQDMADALGIDRVTYTRWKNNESDIKSDYLPKIAQLINVPLQELFENPTTNINITSNHENRENATLNGAIIIITDKNAVDDLVKVLNEKLKK